MNAADRRDAETGWFPGRDPDASIPAHPAALQAGGCAFLTRAFHAAGSLPPDNQVSAISRCTPCAGGSTGRKLFLDVVYEKADPRLHTELFVKFSRDFDDPIRDQGRQQMAAEVRFARLSRMPGFPIAVPTCYFADFHPASGSGILITERIRYGEDGIEPHYEKCRDHALPDPLGHYQAVLNALARLAAADQAGQLPAQLTREFPFEPSQLTVGAREPYTAQQLQNRVRRYAEFASRYPRLLPDHLRQPDFIARLMQEVTRFPAQEARIRASFEQQPECLGLCHWNANIDNAWFWRNPQGGLECGLMDWGCVSRMHLAMALWGALSGADLSLWDHLDRLLADFLHEFQRRGGAEVDPLRFKRQLLLYVAIMGMTWLLDAPAYIRVLLPDLEADATPLDPRIQGHEMARTQLQMLTNVLHLWATEDFAAQLDAFLAAG